MEILHIRDEYIKLGQAMKLAGIAESGLDAKDRILAGDVLVNGEPELRRGRKLYAGDTFRCGGEEFKIG